MAVSLRCAAQSLRVLALAIGNALTLLALAWAALGRTQAGRPCLAVKSAASQSDWELPIYVVATTAWAAVATWLASSAATPHVRQAAGFCCLNWAAALANLFMMTSKVCSPRGHALQAVSAVAAGLAAPVLLATLVASLDLAISRIESVEAHALRSFGAWRLRWVLRAIAAMTVVMLALYNSARFMGAGAAKVLLFAVLAVWYSLIGLVWLPSSLVVMWRLLGHTKSAARTAPSWMASWAERARASLSMELLVLCAAVLTSILRLLLGTIRVLEPGLAKALHWPWFFFHMADHPSNMTCALVLSGALACSGQGLARRARMARQRRARQAAARRRWLRDRAAEANTDWHGKVEELSGRGITLSALLEFYAALPQTMGHFAPGLHSTANVVRQAVIPLTSGAGCSAAELLMGNACTPPQKMVTHAWSNLFRDLVAAVVADAFGEGEHGLYAKLLERDVAFLQDWVSQAKLGERSYWICAFAVNQHLGICGLPDTHPDPVTGLPSPACSCLLDKAFSHTPPFLPDGRSIPCEMNKFDDMMRLLSSRNPDFAQVIAIDANFKTFSRAWCIAEMATASDMGMRQGISVGSEAELQEHRERLRGLKIVDMEASRPEDREMILGSIEDHAAFDASVQSLIFEELLPSWEGLDAQERMAAVGRVIKWQSKPVLERLGAPLEEASAAGWPAQSAGKAEKLSL